MFLHPATRPNLLRRLDMESITGIAKEGKPKRHWIHRLSNINKNTKEADCTNCGHVRIRNKMGIWRCTIGIKATDKTSTGLGYGYRNGNCEICGRTTDKLVKDHNHKTGTIRGWICCRCNYLVGFIEVNTFYANILKYIKRHDP